MIAETYRSSRSQTKRRTSVNDQLDELDYKVDELTEDIRAVVEVWEDRWSEERRRYVLRLV